MPFAPKATIDLALKERIRIAYRVEERPIVEVERVAGVGRATLYRWFHAWDWPLRKEMLSLAKRKGGGPAFRVAATDREPAPAETGWQTAPRESLKLRLQRLVEHRIAILEHEAMAGVAVDADANARAIELNARTLVTIERLGGQAEPCPNCNSDGRPTRTLSELRDELRGHLERIWDEDRESGLPCEEAGGEVGSVGPSCHPLRHSPENAPGDRNPSTSSC